MRIGAHVSIAGGIANAPERAAAIGAECVQTFASSPRSWQAPDFSNEEIERYRREARRRSVRPLFFHAIYLANLAAPDAALRRKSVASVTSYLEAAARIGAEGVIMHVGSHRGDGIEKGIDRVVKSIKRVLSDTPRTSVLCLENTAGGGDTIGRTVEELGAVIRGVQSRRLMVCIDTAHAFESGYDIRTSRGIEAFARAFSDAVGADRLAVLHVNDSKTALGSNVDRHENIGEGELGLGAFKALMRHRLFSSVPWLLEVPGFDGAGPDKKNIGRLKRMRG